jgi:predicted transcriptional regulator
MTFSFDPSIFTLVFSSLAMAQKFVRTLHDWEKIIQEIEKNPGEKRVDIAKRLGLPASTLNTIFTKKNNIREQIQKCGNTCKKRKTGKESTFAELEMVLFTPRLIKL